MEELNKQKFELKRTLKTVLARKSLMVMKCYGRYMSIWKE